MILCDIASWHQVLCMQLSFVRPAERMSDLYHLRHFIALLEWIFPTELRPVLSVLKRVGAIHVPSLGHWVHLDTRYEQVLP